MFSPLAPDALRSWDEGINTAFSLVTGKGYSNPFASAPSGPTAYVTPSFPVEVATIFSIFGAGKRGAVARDIFAAAGYSLLFALLPAFALWLRMPAQAGAIAGFAGALYPIYSPGDLFQGRDEWLAAIGGMLLLLYGRKLARAERLTAASMLLYGAGWGALMYVLPTMATILPVHLLLIFLVRRRGGALLSREHLTFAALTAAAFLLMILPWTIRNRTVMGGWFFMRDNVGFELDISNGDGALPSFAANAATGWFCEHHPDCNAAVAGRIHDVGELEFTRRASGRAVSWITAHPAHFAGLTARRALTFWLGLRGDVISMGVKTTCLLLALVGLVLMWNSGLRLETAMIAALWAVYPLVYYLVQYTDRYPVAISPGILLPAGYALVRLYSGRENQRPPNIRQAKPPAPLLPT